jgi:hypothetical protein
MCWCVVILWYFMCYGMVWYCMVWYVFLCYVVMLFCYRIVCYVLYVICVVLCCVVLCCVVLCCVYTQIRTRKTRPFTEISVILILSNSDYKYKIANRVIYTPV